ncbi:hypothetical protein L9F63_026614, partial [Diploptera punctata]
GCVNILQVYQSTSSSYRVLLSFFPVVYLVLTERVPFWPPHTSSSYGSSRRNAVV